MLTEQRSRSFRKMRFFGAQRSIVPVCRQYGLRFRAHRRMQRELLSQRSPGETPLAACEAWKKSGCKDNWIDAVTEVSKLERKYIRKHSPTIQAGCKRSEIYCLRHSALTMLAESGCDAGHSSITITLPQADAIERAFGNLAGGHRIAHSPELPANEESGRTAVL